MTESQRALELMGVASFEQRRARRRSINMGGTIQAGETSSLAWIKDISESGICLYTKHHPAVGESIQVKLPSQKVGAGLREVYDGTVIRVQESGAGAAFGVAISLSVGTTMMKSA